MLRISSTRQPSERVRASANARPEKSEEIDQSQFNKSSNFQSQTLSLSLYRSVLDSARRRHLNSLRRAIAVENTPVLVSLVSVVRRIPPLFPLGAKEIEVEYFEFAVATDRFHAHHVVFKRFAARNGGCRNAFWTLWLARGLLGRAVCRKYV